MICSGLIPSSSARSADRPRLRWPRAARRGVPRRREGVLVIRRSTAPGQAAPVDADAHWLGVLQGELDNGRNCRSRLALKPLPGLMRYLSSASAQASSRQQRVPVEWKSPTSARPRPSAPTGRGCGGRPWGLVVDRDPHDLEPAGQRCAGVPCPRCRRCRCWSSTADNRGVAAYDDAADADGNGAAAREEGGGHRPILARLRDARVSLSPCLFKHGERAGVRGSNRRRSKRLLPPAAQHGGEDGGDEEQGQHQHDGGPARRIQRHRQEQSERHR